jgi:hypothetical protein
VNAKISRGKTSAAIHQSHHVTSSESEALEGRDAQTFGMAEEWQWAKAGVARQIPRPDIGDTF